MASLVVNVDRACELYDAMGRLAEWKFVGDMSLLQLQTLVGRLIRSPESGRVGTLERVIRDPSAPMLEVRWFSGTLGVLAAFESQHLTGTHSIIPTK